MIEGINSLGPAQSMQGWQGVQGIAGEIGKQKVKEEFLAIFYKELLKQAFTPPDFSVGDEKSSLTSSFGSDLLVERLALELARSGAFSADALLPNRIGE